MQLTGLRPKQGVAFLDNSNPLGSPSASAHKSETIRDVTVTKVAATGADANQVDVAEAAKAWEGVEEEAGEGEGEGDHGGQHDAVTAASAAE